VNFRGYGGAEEKGLPFGGRRQDGKAFLDVWKHTPGTSGEKSVSLVEYDYSSTTKATYSVFAR
jgi:hypothetical protein